ncbi:hypothetical protein SAMN05428945_1439 [Streptomyces sp. 2224.1]|uniref:hypothetical protein n=1 Tax=unclassified Streptomyces TaxID=2593676 RepID=UPI0008911170|nr:hypothetical protein SAMN05216511_3315 [Streptomyces sp. KS_16]SEB88632.1 hypothetical protein SAMN05428945_1439 [Streptomyces sp. 2224.1]SEE65682.1 hypothetical protein SAMN05428954_3363 [Streptomyces sp. 2112.3]
MTITVNVVAMVTLAVTVLLAFMVAGLAVTGGMGVVALGLMGVRGVRGALRVTGVIMTMRVGALACHMAYRGTPIRLRLLP